MSTIEQTLRSRSAHLRLRRLSRLAAAVAVSLAACETQNSPTDPETSFFESTGPREGTYFGAAVRVGDGLARGYVTVRNGEVEEVGVALGERALQGLPAGSGHSDGTDARYNEYVLQMHPQTPTPYRWVGLNWNAEGHEPDDVYTLPHFDFHFYTISVEERSAIQLSNPRWTEQANNLPAPEFIPEHYAPAGPPELSPAEIAIPLMGVHWVDLRSPELPWNGGETFTETFIYGTWDGKVIFAEPMITKAFLETKPNFRRTLPTAQRGPNPGSYRIYWHDQRREYRIALTDLPPQ